MSAPRACILGCSGPELTASERDFFRDADPWGFILFARNLRDPDQLRRLTGALRDAVGRAAPILIDQEGGRVQRLGPPHWTAWPPVRALCAAGLAEDALREALFLRYRLIAAELDAVGIDVNCVPAVDLARPETHPMLADRLLGEDPATVAARGRVIAEATRAGGVLPVVKHVPGHGRSDRDSHLTLPVVATDLDTLRATDFAAFVALADLPLAMTAHVLYPALDAERCATLSPAVIAEIRERIGFSGLLMSDDIGMGALRGPVAARGRAALAAGCDVVLHCAGDRAEMEALAAELPPLAGVALARARAAEAARQPAAPFDAAAARARLAAITGERLHA
ncbi:MAG: beta-N-acetylhexosaminidase [Paracoccaceae bacterium]|nr:MAG: beta-N-acetylhexosaminidase [Paracoccaceae bacterium]